MFNKFMQLPSIRRIRRIIYLFKRKLHYILHPKLKEQLNRKAEKLLGVKVIETTDILYGIREKDLQEK